MFPISWNTQALADLDEITDYVSEFDVRAAIALHDLIESSVMPASKYPYLFRPARVPGTREVLAHPNYIVVYKFADKVVEVVNVLHTRQEYP